MFTDRTIFKLVPSQEVLNLQQNVVDELKPKQKEKVKELRNRVGDLLEPRHNDFYLLKWLKARKFDVPAAEKMLKENLRWRKEWRVDEILTEFEIPEVLTKYLPMALVGEDKEGSPVIVTPQGHFDVKGAFSCVTRIDFIKCLIYTVEYLERAAIQQSEKHKKVISAYVMIGDLENYKFQTLIWKPALYLSDYQSKMYAAHYPEILKMGIIVNAPAFMHRVFGILKPFLSEEIKKKMSFYGKDGWKDVLLKFIEADQLPKQWGGTMVNEVDGNPYGNVPMGGPIPESYYKTLSMEPEKMNSATVPRGEKLKASMVIEESGAVISWTFQTENHDIAFGITVSPSNSERSVDTNNNQARVVIPLERTNSFLCPEDGKHTCEESGTYTFTFDNSYSWTRSKKLLYCIQITRPDGSVTDVTVT